MATSADSNLHKLFPHDKHTHNYHHFPHYHYHHYPLERNCACAPEGLLPSTYLHGGPCFSHLLKNKPCSVSIVSPIVEPLFKRQKSKCPKE